MTLSALGTHSHHCRDPTHAKRNFNYGGSDISKNYMLVAIICYCPGRGLPQSRETRKSHVITKKVLFSDVIINSVVTAIFHRETDKTMTPVQDVSFAKRAFGIRCMGEAVLALPKISYVCMFHTYNIEISTIHVYKGGRRESDGIRLEDEP